MRLLWYRIWLTWAVWRELGAIMRGGAHDFACARSPALDNGDFYGVVAERVPLLRGLKSGKPGYLSA